MRYVLDFNTGVSRSLACETGSFVLTGRAASLNHGAAEGGSWYVSPTGSPSNDGSFGSPWDLATGLAGGDAGQVQPGNTVWLRGGTYTGAHHAVTVSGAPGNLVVFRSYPGEWAIFDGGANAVSDVISWQCAYTAFWGVIITSSQTDRTSDDVESWGAFDSPHTGVQNSQETDPSGLGYGTGTKLINCYIKNLGGGVSTWSNGKNTEVYGCSIYYHGWIGDPGGLEGGPHAWGVGYYTQNVDPSTRIFEDNLVWGNHEYAVQAYGESALLDNHDCEGNIVFADGAIRPSGSGGNVTIGGGSAAPTGNIWKKNATYGNGVVTFERGCESLDCRDNLHGYPGTNGGEWNLTGQTGTPVVTGNKVYSGLIQPSNYGSLWPSNEWHRWSQEYGGPDSKPTGEWTLVRPNKYEAGRGHVAIFNWDHHDTVDVDVSSILQAGQGYAVYHAMDPLGSPVATGTFGGTTITFPMTNLPVEAPTNGTTPASTGPEFAAFIVVATEAPPPEGWFVATDGSSSGAGTIDDPWDLATALLGGPDGVWDGGSVNPMGTYVQPGDTIWLRTGTYTAPYQASAGMNFSFQLQGTETEPITMRAFPGERVIFDGNYDPDVVGYHGGIVGLRGYFTTRGFLILRDVEITNSNVHRLCLVDGANARNEGAEMVAKRSKLINCIIHDTGEGAFLSSMGAGWECYGNLVYFNGYYQPFAEQNQAICVDLIPAGGTAVALSGSWTANQGSNYPTCTIANHNNTGDYTLVAVHLNGQSAETITATYGGDAMTRLGWLDGYSKSVAIFGIKGHGGTHDVVITTTASGGYLKGLAQSFVNVAQNEDERQNAVQLLFSVADGAMTAGDKTLYSATGGFTSDMAGAPIEVPNANPDGITLRTHIDTVTDSNHVELLVAASNTVSGKTIRVTRGMWFINQWGTSVDGCTAITSSGDPPVDLDVGIAVPSAANHLVVDAMSIYAAYQVGPVTPSGDNAGNIIGGPAGYSTTPYVRMSYAAGAASVDMHWAWEMKTSGHGHGFYVQSGLCDPMRTTAGNTTIEWGGFTGGNATSGPFRSHDQGATIRILGAGAGGVDLVTTIDSYTDNSHVVVHVAPSLTMNAEASWGWPAKMKHNLVFEEANYSAQFYGSSGAACVNAEISENFFYRSGLIVGGLPGFRLTDSYFHHNYTWSLSVNIGDYIDHCRNFRFRDNYHVGASVLTPPSYKWDDLEIDGNTFIYATYDSNLHTGFPDNDFLTTNPTSNLIVVFPNEYESNRANILVYNWENLTTVDVDLSSAVAVGTPIRVMNAQDYFAEPVWEGIYDGDPIALPMTGLTVAAAVGGAGGDAGGTLTPYSSPCPAFAAFIVRAQSAETWR